MIDNPADNSILTRAHLPFSLSVTTDIS